MTADSYAADSPAAKGKVFTALAVSVDGYITGRDPGPGHGLGDGGMLFDWYFNGDTASQVFDGFRLSEPSRDEVILHQVPCSSAPAAASSATCPPTSD